MGDNLIGLHGILTIKKGNISQLLKSQILNILLLNAISKRGIETRLLILFSSDTGNFC